MKDDLKISLKKPSYPVSSELKAYLQKFNRTIRLPVFYDDLLRFQGSVEVFDKNDKNTLWIRTYYNESERVEIDLNLKRIYTTLHSDGNDKIIPFINVDAIDYCTFGNSKPFRIKIRNILNDNYAYFYVKKADASRIYGLELEHMLSPHNLNFLVFNDTLIEEHITGIPGDEFIENMLPNCSESEKSQIAKEFVKFNERCMIRLLGDMRSYNYVIVPTHDFDHVVYSIRAIDFDQQCFEGKFNVYRPQFFKENFKMVDLVSEKFEKMSINQYKLEERSIVAKRLMSYKNRVERLIKSMIADTISTPDHETLLKTKIFEYTNDPEFLKSKNMGEILKNALGFVKKNYQTENTDILF
jgi:hypothetical protein